MHIPQNIRDLFKVETSNFTAIENIPNGCNGSKSKVVVHSQQGKPVKVHFKQKRVVTNS